MGIDSLLEAGSSGHSKRGGCHLVHFHQSNTKRCIQEHFKSQFCLIVTSWCCKKKIQHRIWVSVFCHNTQTNILQVEQVVRRLQHSTSFCGKLKSRNHVLTCTLPTPRSLLMLQIPPGWTTLLVNVYSKEYFTEKLWKHWPLLGSIGGSEKMESQPLQL